MIPKKLVLMMAACLLPAGWSSRNGFSSTKKVPHIKEIFHTEKFAMFAKKAKRQIRTLRPTLE